jgi:hypothetical protein
MDIPFSQGQFPGLGLTRSFEGRPIKGRFAGLHITILI